MDRQRDAQRMIILTQVVGVPVLLMVQGPFMMTYLAQLGLSGSGVLDIMALLALVRTLIMPPLAYAGDRFGKKRQGGIGIAGMLLALCGLALLPGLPEHLRTTPLVVSMGMYGMGSGLLGAIWFGLLTPLIDAGERGRFLSRLRISWQLSSLLLLALVSWILKQNSSLGMYQSIFTACAGLMAVRLFLFSRIPEVEPPSGSRVPFWTTVMHQLRDPRLRGFCSYAFLLSVVVAPITFVNTLLMQETLGFSEGRIVLVGNLAGAGSIAGFFLGGRMVDRFGTKSVFVTAHLSYAILFALTPLHALPGWPVLLHFAAVSMGMGLIVSASGIAMSTTMMELADTGGQRALSTALTSSTMQLGAPVAMFLVSRLLHWNILADRWILTGLDMGPYDAINLLAAVAALLLLITLGLVPYSLRDPRPLPRMSNNT